MGGKNGACSLCGVKVFVPTAGAAQDGTIRFACPNGHHMTVPGAVAGKKGRCSQCQADVIAPSVTRQGIIWPVCIAQQILYRYAVLMSH